MMNHYVNYFKSFTSTNNFQIISCFNSLLALSSALNVTMHHHRPAPSSSIFTELKATVSHHNSCSKLHSKPFGPSSRQACSPHNQICYWAFLYLILSICQVRCVAVFVAPSYDISWHVQIEMPICWAESAANLAIYTQPNTTVSAMIATTVSMQLKAAHAAYATHPL